MLAQHLGIPGVLGTATGLVLVLLVITASITDLRWRRIFNWTTYSAALWALILNLTASLLPENLEITRPGTWPLPGLAPRDSASVPVRELLGARGLEELLLGVLICGGIMLFLFALFRGGGGDVKLVATIGALLGWEHGVEAWIYGCVVAGVFAACYVVWVIGPGGVLAALLRLCGAWRLSARLGVERAPPLRSVFQRRIPMAPFLAVGALAALL
jgi:prepilin peptidase CpaA